MNLLSSPWPLLLPLGSNSFSRISIRNSSTTENLKNSLSLPSCANFSVLLFSLRMVTHPKTPYLNIFPSSAVVINVVAVTITAFMTSPLEVLWRTLTLKTTDQPLYISRTYLSSPSYIIISPKYPIRSVGRAS